MPRLDQQRQKELEPKRMDYAIKKIQELGFEIIDKTKDKLQFEFKDSKVTLFVYSGWHTGKTIKDGRGIKNLLKQLK